VRPLALVLLAASALVHAERSTPLKPGIEFAGPEVRARQADDFANPGMLWLARGENLWSAPAGTSGKSCADCHGDATKSMKGVATRFPRFDTVLARVVNLEGKINACRERRQEAGRLAPESEELLGLEAYVAHQSRGEAMAVDAHPAINAYLERGRALYNQRIGQMNLACTHCHDRNWGKRLLGETISQGHPTAFPAYRLGWESMGSLARRIRACFYGVRAEMPDYGSPELLELEVYLAWRAKGLQMEAPGVRR